jgi:hypothetical protein
MKRKEFTMNGVVYKNMSELVDRVNSRLTHYASLFGKSYYPVDYVKLVFDAFVPMEQYEFDCDLQPVEFKGILSFVGKGVLKVYGDDGELLLTTTGHRGNDVTMSKDDKDKPLDIADASAVAESLLLKRCLKNMGIGADLSIDSALSSCAIAKNLKILPRFKETLGSSKKGSRGKKGADSKGDDSPVVPDVPVSETSNNPNVFTGSVKIISQVTEKEDKVSFWINVEEYGNVLACISKQGPLARLIGQIKSGMVMEIMANVHVNGNGNNVLEVTKITNF